MEPTRRIVFVSRQLSGEALRSAVAITRLANVCLLGICEQSTDPQADELFFDLIRVDDTHSAEQLLRATRTLSANHGPLEQVVTAQETLLAPVALTNQVLGLSGLDVFTVGRVLDKSALKATLTRAGLNTPGGALVASAQAAEHFASRVGFPIVLKPLSGSGGLATWCIRDAAQLKLALELTQPSAANALLVEECCVGEEVCIDTITIDSEPRFYSVCRYRQPILAALEKPEIQWSCVLPRNITTDAFEKLISEGLKAVRALQVGNAITHIEGFLLNNDDCCFTDATLRPAGARIGPMLGFACDMDPHIAWARAVIDGCFDGPWERKYAVGTIFLRGDGSGTIQEIEGIETVSRELGALIVDKRWPQAGANKSATYTGDGYVTIRHPETQAVEEALDFIAKTVCIEYSTHLKQSFSGVREIWQQRLQHFDKQLNRPVWES